MKKNTSISMIMLLLAWFIPLSTIAAKNSCDVNNDGEVNVADVNAVINAILGGDFHNSVDLGLPSGTLWATRNVGATSPEGNGYYYAWGETETKGYYDGDNYKWGTYHSYPIYDVIYLSKYCTDSDYGVNGFYDNKTTLDSEDDAAYVNWGSTWRMPTYYQFYELVSHCSKTWETRNGVNGCLFTGPNGNTLFLPAAGQRGTSFIEERIACYYWTSSLYSSRPYEAECFIFGSNYYASSNDICSFLRYKGCSVRAVRKSNVENNPDVNKDDEINIADVNAVIDAILGGHSQQQEGEFVDLGLPSGTLWASRNVGANSPEEYGSYFAWGETAPKEVYTWQTYKWCNGSKNTITKYCTNGDYGIVDNKTELDPEDDAAYVNWGPSWRTPSKEQLDELREKCSWQWTRINDVNGRLVTGPNGNTIFMPAAGSYWGSWNYDKGSWGYYLSRSLSLDESNRICILDFTSGSVFLDYNGRYAGYTIRAVRCF